MHQHIDLLRKVGGGRREAGGLHFVPQSGTYTHPSSCRTTTLQAKIDDERVESVPAKMREDATGKDVAAPVKNKTSRVDMKV
jgi:hypothetical protein